MLVTDMIDGLDRLQSEDETVVAQKRVSDWLNETEFDHPYYSEGKGVVYRAHIPGLVIDAVRKLTDAKLPSPATKQAGKDFHTLTIDEPLETKNEDAENTRE